eukprot:CAMPEP_0117829876 /NCGR_PEP_ID=MMETSP0949-20121206/8127_1 /TAXON_ID=44440 /ORGANISM="Chattonella subsalsa, Strain CCMP2191" /LENGTH=232 /DNA_ID=CAMNT_0005670711 /DNA_START=769 /DNA_END=1467 /DNA_ORIENTATION=+
MTNHVDFLQEAAEHKIGMPEPQRSQTTSSDGFYEKCRFVTGLDSPVVNEWKRVLKQGENQIQRENVHSHLRKRRKYRHASLLTAQEVAKCQMSQKEMITEIPFSDFKKCLSLRSNPLLNDTAGAEKYMVPFSEPWPESCWGVSLNLLMYEVRWNGLYTLEKPERYILLKRLGLQRIYPPWLKPKVCGPCNAPLATPYAGSVGGSEAPHVAVLRPGVPFEDGCPHKPRLAHSV